MRRRVPGGASVRAKGRSVEAGPRALASTATDAGATFDKTVTLDANKLEPMNHLRTNPGMGMGITGRIPYRPT